MADPAGGSPRTGEPTHVGWLLVVASVVALGWNLIGNLILPGAWYVPANLAVGIVLVALARGAGLGAADLGVERREVGRGIVVGLGAAVVVAVVLAVALLVPETRGLFEDDTVLEDGAAARWFVPLVRIPLGTAVFEEILFRSVLLGALLIVIGRRPAVLASAVLFGLWHIVPTWETSAASGWALVGEVVAVVSVTTAGGLAFAMLRLWSRSILAPILAHTATNSLAYVAALLALEVLG